MVVHTPQEVFRQRILVRFGKDRVDFATGAKRRVAAFVFDPLLYLLRVEYRQAVKASAPVNALQRLPVANTPRMSIQDQLVDGIFSCLMHEFKKPTERCRLRNTPRSIRSAQPSPADRPKYPLAK